MSLCFYFYLLLYYQKYSKKLKKKKKIIIHNIKYLYYLGIFIKFMTTKNVGNPSVN